MEPAAANRAIQAAAMEAAANYRAASASGRRTPADAAAEDVVSLEQQLAELRDELAREHELASPPLLSSSPPAPFVSKHKEAALAPVQRDLSAVLDSLEGALLKLQGPVTHSPRPRARPAASSPHAQRALEYGEPAAADGEPVLVDSATIHDHLRRLHAYFCTTVGGASAASAERPREATMSSAGFCKIARAAQLVSEHCTQVDLDLIFCKVVKTRSARMALPDFYRGLAILALRLYPHHATQSEAFHELLSDHLLPWAVQLEHALAATQLAHPQVALLLARHAAFLQRAFELYLNTPAQPISAEVAALPEVLLQWPQFVAFARDFELCPTALTWAQLARFFCLGGTCATPAHRQRPQSHGVTLAQFTQLVGVCALEMRQSPPPPDANKTAREKDAESLAVHTPAFVRVKRLFAKLLATPAAAALLAPPPPSATRGPLSS